MENRKKILLIIPAYNESEGIVEVIQNIKEYQEESPYLLDFIVINDGSTDNEEEILINNKINHVRLIQNLGIGGAVQTGYKYALENDYDIAIQYDGDGQHDIKSLSKLVEPILNGTVDFTVGSRFTSDSSSDFKSSFMRQAGIRWLSALVKLVTGFRVRDITSGYRAGNKKVIKQFSEHYPVKYPEPESYVYLVRRKVRIQEVGVKMFERQTGKSSINPWSGVKYMINVSSAILVESLLGKK